MQLFAVKLSPLACFKAVRVKPSSGIVATQPLAMDPLAKSQLSQTICGQQNRL